MVSNNRSLQPIRGTKDILPAENSVFRKIEETAFEVATRYGFGEISTPVMEFTEIFARTLGDTSDIVTKEMYTFEDRAGDSITLRPEGTASVARAFISNGLSQELPLKLFYRGPMFRYERPQKGRRRQFHQVGIELIGVPNAQADIEVIALGQHFLTELGLRDAITLEINSLGDAESKSSYRNKLVEYLSDYKGQLSEESLTRIKTNPMRILDSKDDNDREILKKAPLMRHNLNDKSKRFFEDIIKGLELLNIQYSLNDRLVRGLDYYSHTAFEFTSKNLGAQNTLLAGGRYDSLISQMGGPDTPGIGWAAGIERLELLVKIKADPNRPISIIPVSDNLANQALSLADRLRHEGFKIELGYSGNLGKRMKRANKLDACAVILLGDTEISRNIGLVKDMDSGEQIEVSLENLVDHLEKYRLTGTTSGNCQS